MKNMSVIDLFDNVNDFELIDVTVMNEMINDYRFENVVNVEGFDFDNSNVKMVKSDGYRGNGCYEGLIEKDGKLFYIDVMNDEIEEIV